MAIHDLLASVVLKENRDAIFCILLLDPLSAVCSPQEIREMSEELVLAEADQLLEFMKP